MHPRTRTLRAGEITFQAGWTKKRAERKADGTCVCPLSCSRCSLRNSRAATFGPKYSCLLHARVTPSFSRSVSALSNRAGPSRCLDAFIIALNQACDGNRCWYTSTKQLQLASMEFCTACRSVPTLCVNVEKDTPTRLWAGGAPGRETRNAKRLSATRVSVVQALEVTWKLPASALRRMGDVLAKVKRFAFDDAFDGDVRGVVWPCELERLTFGYSFNQPIKEVAWPESLRYLVIRGDFKQPLQGVSWAPSLEGLLLLGILPHESFCGTVWPASLKHLFFGGGFNHPVDTRTWPPSLQTLHLGAYFNQPIAAVNWPPCLKVIYLGQVFNQAIDIVSWPGSLKAVTFGWQFNQPVARVRWPASLEHLDLGETFNQPITGVKWPPCLTNLDLGSGFNKLLTRFRGLDR